MTKDKQIHQLLEMKPDEFRSKCTLLDTDEIPFVFQEIRTSPSMVLALVSGLQERPQLESLGKEITSDRLLDLFDTCLALDHKEHWKLSPLLVGVPHGIFLELLMSASEEQISMLKHESVAKPVQHHLTTLTHDMRNRIEDVTHQLNRLESHIVTVDVEEISRREIAELSLQIEDTGYLYEEIIEILNRILAIVWSTNRTDLIEMLTIEKESCQRILAKGVGHPKKGNRHPTGLFSLLNEKLNSVYGNPLDMEDIEALNGNEPASEALVKLSVWYLRDYWDLGLLPQIKKLENLDLDMQFHTEEERKEYRENLFQEVENNLERIGLSTVKDFKKNMIYSKKILQKFIKEKKL